MRTELQLYQLAPATPRAHVLTEHTQASQNESGEDRSYHRHEVWWSLEGRGQALTAVIGLPLDRVPRVSPRHAFM